MSSPSRLLHPALNPTGLTAAAGAIIAAATMLYNMHYHHGVLNAPVLFSGGYAVIALLTRFVVTPVADPKDGNGNQLVPKPVSATGGVVPSGPGDAVPIVPGTGVPPAAS